jgi:hypothetical protein
MSDKGLIIGVIIQLVLSSGKAQDLKRRVRGGSACRRQSMRKGYHAAQTDRVG